jgi:hypothetical protein
MKPFSIKRHLRLVYKAILLYVHQIIMEYSNELELIAPEDLETLEILRQLLEVWILRIRFNI